MLFIGLTLANYHLLFLDEPTNHLDLEGKDELAETLNQFTEGFILVSHDRHLIEKSCNRFWFIDDQRLEEWFDLESLYTAMGVEQSTPRQLKNETPESAEIADLKPCSSHEDTLLEQLIDLETHLEAGLGRKPTYQKPKLQKQWRETILQITNQLGLE